jgi:hypothetical protein
MTSRPGKVGKKRALKIDSNANRSHARADRTQCTAYSRVVNLSDRDDERSTSRVFTSGGAAGKITNDCMHASLPSVGTSGRKSCRITSCMLRVPSPALGPKSHDKALPVHSSSQPI